MKIKFASLLVLIAVSLTACKSGVEKGSLIGRTASIIENNQQILAFAKADVKEIINKSGVFEGAIPQQYADIIGVYKESVFKALDMDQPMHVLLEGPMSKEGQPHALMILFQVKDLKKLKSELKQLGVGETERNGLYYLSQDDMSVGVKENFGILYINPNQKGNFEKMQKIIASSEHSVDNESLAEVLNSDHDISLGFDVQRLAKMAAKNDANLSKTISAGMLNDMKGSYGMLCTDFETGKAVIKAKFFYSDAMSKYKPLQENGVSNTALHSVGQDEAVMALAINLEYEKLFNLIYNALSKEQKTEVDNNLAMVGGKDQLSKMFSGELVAAVGKIDSSSFTSRIWAYAGLNDASYLKSLVAGFAPLAGLDKASEGIYANDDMNIALSDKGFVFSTDKESFKNAAAGKSNGIQTSFGFDFGASPISAFIDFTKLDTADFDADAKLVITAMEYVTLEGDNSEMTLTLVSKNKNDNILKALISLFVKERLSDMFAATPKQATKNLVSMR